MTRRVFLAGLALKPTDIRIAEVRHTFEDFRYRAPYMFGGRTVDRVTMLNVETTVETRAGKRAKGFAAMSLGNAWAWPSRPYDESLEAMKALAGAIAGIAGSLKESGHPVELGVKLEAEVLRAARNMPKLAALVVASPFDASIHDAFGKLHGRSAWRCYGADFLSGDLSRFLGPKYKGRRLDRYVLQSPKPRVGVFHSVGASDPIFASDVRKPVGDGLPETLPEWIRYNGIVHVKIKLNGADLVNDIERTVAIDRAAREAEAAPSKYCVDFNERCPNVDFLLEYLRKVREKTVDGFDRILYIEQPTARDLRANPSNVMHQAAKLRPIVVDESLTGVESLLLAKEMGYTGAALKACKGQTQVLLMAAAAQEHKMFLCVQDLTCPGAALIHSVGIAAHFPGVAGIEANARQYVPSANQTWEARYPGIFRIKDGYMRTDQLKRPGLAT